jgi:hypothetical protein
MIRAYYVVMIGVAWVFFELLDAEDETTKILQNVTKYLPVDRA